jgi:hypothetical protein
LHTFLVGLYIILFVYFRNIAEVTLSMTYRSIFICLVVSIILFGLGYFFFRSKRKAGIFSTLILISFFTYGFVYNQLEVIFYKGLWPFAHIHRFLVLVYILLYLVLFILFYRSRRALQELNYALNSFILIVFLLNICFGLLNSNAAQKVSNSENIFIAAKSHGTHPVSLSADSLPDVYYIVLDGYAAEKTLQNFYSDKDPILYRFLRKRGFYMADSSRANYPFTVVSLSSSMNLDYLDSVNSSYPLNELIRQNLVSHVFKQANYRIINIESGFAVTEKLALIDKTIKVNALNEFENRLLELTVLRLDDILGLSHYIRLKGQLAKLGLFVRERGPKFSFIHIVSPHPPYVVDSSGHRKMRTTISDIAWEPRKDYLQQLQYTSSQIMKFIDLILKSSKVPPVIVLQSDHGPWISDKNSGNIYEARSRILNAFYVPNSIKSRLYQNITPVNSFRLIFSQIFNEQYPLLPDRPFSFSELSKEVLFRKYNR